MRPISYLTPLAWIYGIAARSRARLYQAGYLPSHKLPGTTISVGNLTTGGTGKTPVVLWLAQQFVGEGRRVAILTRGYRGKPTKPAADAPPGAAVASALVNDSDEVRLLASHLGDSVAFGISPKRFLEGMKLAQRGINTFILDDGFQHLELARDVNVLLVDASNPFGGGKILPAGYLREPRSAIARADVVGITRTTSSPAVEAIVRRYTQAPIVYIDFEVQAVKPLEEEDASSISATDLAGLRWFAFSGIGNAQAFVRNLKGWNFNLAGHKDFPDHHKFTPADIRAIVNTAASVNATHLICTEKDKFNLPADANFGMPAYYCTIALSSAAQLALWNAIQSVVAAKTQAAS